MLKFKYLQIRHKACLSPFLVTSWPQRHNLFHENPLTPRPPWWLCHKLCVIQSVLCSFKSSLHWKYISSHVHIRILYSVLHLKEFIDINLRKNSMIYTQSTHLISSTTPNDYPVPRLSCKVFRSRDEFSRHNDDNFLTHSPPWLTQVNQQRKE